MTDAPKPDLRALIRAVRRKLLTECYRCHTTPLTNDISDWSIQVMFGQPISVLCPKCQTPEERAEVTIRQATSTYTVERGRIVQQPKPDDTDE